MAPCVGRSLASAMVVVWVVACAMEVHCTEVSSFEAYWKQQLPSAPMPDALINAASPLSESSTQELLAEIKQGRPGCLQGAMADQGALQGMRDMKSSLLCTIVNVGGSGGSCRLAADAARQSAVFFKPESLQQEAAQVRVPDTRNSLGGATFLPPALSSALPMSPARALSLLSLFAIPADSPAALHVRNTLALCAYATSAHDTFSCHASGESMVSFVARALGPHATVAYAPASAKQLATVLHVSTLAHPGDKVAACYNMEFPSLLYSCHLSTSSRVMDVSLQLQDGTPARGLATCHVDTSHWTVDHVAFQVLNVQPGQGAVCHWVPENSFVFMQG